MKQLNLCYVWNFKSLATGDIQSILVCTDSESTASPVITLRGAGAEGGDHEARMSKDVAIPLQQIVPLRTKDFEWEGNLELTPTKQ